MKKVLWLLCGTLLGGCVMLGSPVGRGHVITPETKIEAEDGSFQLVSGVDFATPFHTDCIRRAYFRGPLTEAYEDAQEQGAKKVRVSLPYLKTPLYGVLTFCTIGPGGYGPGTRSHEIVVPREYADAATNGKISVVYESVPSRDPKGPDNYYGWILWLSDRPFPGMIKRAAAPRPASTAGDGPVSTFMQ